ncbi:uncharacterized protein LOC135101038 [Scylla paramamosain]|uniref:uncharacterized protein LOC135101038 n=1 Tax=Scylla paramamosain TaxID=85552 RepID=UPI003083C84F
MTPAPPRHGIPTCPLVLWPYHHLTFTPAFMFPPSPVPQRPTSIPHALYNYIPILAPILSIDLHLTPTPSTFQPLVLHNLHISTFLSIPSILLHLDTASASNPPGLYALQMLSTCFPHHPQTPPFLIPPRIPNPPPQLLPLHPFIPASSVPHPPQPIYLPSTPLIPTTCSLPSTPSARSGGVPCFHIIRLFTMRTTYLGLSKPYDSFLNADEECLYFVFGRHS